jgi:hypothetical protein
MVDIELATYQQRIDYVIKQLTKDLRNDTDTVRYINQIDEKFAKYILTEE